jgi:hypothetical protein
MSSRGLGRLRGIMLLALMVGSVGVSHPAEAKKKRVAKIEMTGVKSFDKVFKKAREADRKLKSAERNVRKSKHALRKALKLGKRTTYVQGLKELKGRAKGKLTVVMQGGVPILKAKEAVPTDVMAGIEAVNTLSKSIPSSLRDLKAVTQASTSMYKRANRFPSNIRAELATMGADGLVSLIFKAPKIAKTTLRNIKVIGGMPKRAATVSKDLGQISNAIRKTFL